MLDIVPTTFSDITEAGAVGLAALAMLLTAWTIKIMTNHMAHISENQGKIAGILETMWQWMLVREAENREKAQQAEHDHRKGC